MPTMMVMLASAADVFKFGSRLNLIAIGIVLIVAGFLMRQRAARYNITDMAIDAAWQTAKARGHTPTELEGKMRDIAAEQSNVRRAQMVTRHAAMHVWSKLLGTFGFWTIFVGLASFVGAWFAAS